MKITIATVCRNAKDEIVKTLTSVAEQTLQNFEYLIVDGKSTDGTLDIIDETLKVLNPLCNIRIISEPDKGIYDAMNKAINYANGEWILFLNAGDTLHSKDVLENIEPKLIDTYDFFYGDANYVEEKRSYIVKGKNITVIKKKMPFCHQCVFNRKNAINQYYFNTDYKICADYDLYVRAYSDKCSFNYFPIVISDYYLGGFSSQNLELMLKENVNIRKRNQYILSEALIYNFLRIRVNVGKIAKKLLINK